ncbi:MAG: metallophosphoesterase [Chlamydiia bacterium]|nr:metallophosphoesterase [Chlamydiia bacterium]
MSKEISLNSPLCSFQSKTGKVGLSLLAAGAVTLIAIVALAHLNLLPSGLNALSQVGPSIGLTLLIPTLLAGIAIYSRITRTPPSAKEVVHPPESPSSAVAELMEKFTNAWKPNSLSFEFTDVFNIERFKNILDNHVCRFKKSDFNISADYGYIEKYDLDPNTNPRIYVRADLHGDLKSLIENLRTLQEKGLLDKNFKCTPGAHLVFLGDYCDRGDYGTQVLELLIRLKEENPQQVHLIRGNHEDIDINLQFGRSDKNLRSLIIDQNCPLTTFYSTLSLTTYLSLENRGSREYMQFTHGLFEFGMDPAPLLDSELTEGYAIVPKKLQPSARITALKEEPGPLRATAERVHTIAKDVMNARKAQKEEQYTAYNWADVEMHNAVPDYTQVYLSARQFAVPPSDIQAYLDLSSERHRVAMIFRGHEHTFSHLIHDGRVLVTTLSVGMSGAYDKTRFPQDDRAYILTPNAQVNSWMKRAILRDREDDRTREITGLVSITSDAC